MWVRVLGQLEVGAGEQVAPLRGLKQRRLLAALLAGANQVVSVDRLADLVWAGAPPDGAAAALAKDVYRLRDALGSIGAAGILVTQSPGYRLNLDKNGIDADVFAVLVAQGQQLLSVDPTRAVSVLDEALALWRGEPWAEFADEDFARPLIAGLDELRALAVECRAEAMLTLGRHEDVVAELKPAVEAYPLRERRRSLLMRALYLSGRHAEAVQVYRDFRRVLRDELGLEPSQALRDLEHEILAQSEALAVPRPRPVIAPTHGRALGLPELTAGFVGRVNELAWLEVLLARAAPNQRPVLAWLTGDAGVGKTSLAARFGRLACAQGSAVVYVRCEPGKGVAARLLEVLGAPPAASSPTAEPETPDLPTVVDALARFGDGRRVLLVIDDVDRSRDDVVAFLHELASVPCRCGVYAVAVARALPSDGVSGVPGSQAHTRRLGGLTRDEVGELLEASSGAARPDELVESVWTETGGIPSLAAAVGRRLHNLDINARAEAALTRAEGARRGLEGVQHDIAAGVLARVECVPSAPPASAEQEVAPSGDAICPYKGLASFGRSDSSMFCGRERLVATLVTRLAVNRFLAVIGPSGSGKSSLVAAGLIPALAAGALPGSNRWPCGLFRPGSDPMSSCVAALAKLTGQPPSALRQQLDRDGGLYGALARGVLDEAQPGGGRLVLVVDQFEELFTACRDPEMRAEFIRVLTSGVDVDSALSVVVILRADFYGACATYPALADLMGQSQVLVTAMTDADLRRVVTEPARRAGLTVESGLAETICQDAAAQSGALPLVSTALLETWAARSGSTLTLAGYLMAGGVRGAVARLAESVWDGCDSAQRAACRRIMLRLVDPDGLSADVRRRTRRTELVSGPTEETVLTTLIDRRLLTASEDTVEVAHEALLREWPRLRGWLEEDREGRRLHRQLADAAAAWQADGRDEAGLYRGVRLHAVQDWATAHPGDANALEADFLETSEGVEEQTVRGAVRTSRRLRALAVGLVVLLAVAVVAGVQAAQQRSTARRQALQADTRRLATLASTLPADQRDLALLLGVQAYRLQASNETAGGLQTALVQTPPGLDRIVRYRSSSLLPHLDHGGRLLAVPGADGTVTIDDLASGTVMRTLTWPTPREFAEFSGDDKLVAAGGTDGRIAIWDLASGRPSGRPLSGGTGVAHAVFDPTNDDRLYVISARGLAIWDRHDPEHPRLLDTITGYGSEMADGNTPNLTISPDGRLIAAGDIVVGGLSGAAQVWDTRTLKPVHSFPGSIGVLSDDGRTLPFGYGDDTVLMNARTGRREATVSKTGGAGLAVLSPDRRRIAVSEQDGNANVVVVYDLTTMRPVGAPLRLHDTTAYPVGFLPDGRVVTSSYTEAGIWTLARDLPPLATEVNTEQLQRIGPAPTLALFLPGDARTILTEFDFGLAAVILSPQVHDAATGHLTGTLFNGAGLGPVAPSPDGRYIAAGTRRGGVAIWDLHKSTQVGQLTGVPQGNHISWSPAGNLVAVDTGTSVQLWNVTQPSRPALAASLATHPSGSIDYLLFSPDGRRLLTGSQTNGTVSMIDIATRRAVWPSMTTGSTLHQVALSPDGKSVAIDSGDSGRGQLTVLDAATGKPRRSIPLPSYGGIAYLHHGQWIVATDDPASPRAQLYDAKTLQSIGAPFSPAGDSEGDPVAANNAGTIFSASDVNPVLWNVDPAAWVRTACDIVGRNLTRAEWREYLPDRSYQSTCPHLPPGV